MQNRRGFLKGTAWMGAAAVAAGCMGRQLKIAGCTSGAPMQGYADKPLKKVRVGLIGCGARGSYAGTRLSAVPGTEVTAVCELIESRADAAIDKIVKLGKKRPRKFVGPEAYKAFCEWDGIDVVYNVTSWSQHAKINCYAMECGKHVFTEVPGALTIEDLWRTVETSERTRRHCNMLENCIYGEYEMLAFHMVKLGLLGDIVHGEAGYIHDQRSLHSGLKRDSSKPIAVGGKVVHGNQPGEGLNLWYGKRHGNYYPTHGLGPIARCMDINHGDKFDFLVSLESRQASLEAYMQKKFPADSWQANTKVVKGDMNVSLVRTALGRSIIVQHDVFSPRPYSRLNTVTGTKGVFMSYPELFVAFEDQIGDGNAHKYFDGQKREEIRKKYMHPFWKFAGEISKKVGGHGGMDYIMDLRWSYCLQNGLPLDTDVYDLAAWSSLVELTERSVNTGSRPVEVPDFTRGAWKTAKPFAIDTFDPSKLNLSGVGGVGKQQDV